MNSRREIMQDSDFWTRLEYSATAWLGSEDDKSLRRFWIDGLIPETITDTQRGVDVEGVAWVCQGPDQQSHRFIAFIPQKLLHRRKTFDIEGLTIDGEKRRLEITLSAASNT